MNDVPADDVVPDTTFAITVFGVARPKGSSRAFTPKNSDRIVVTADNVKTKPWQQQISAEAQLWLRLNGGRMMQGPVALSVWFWLPRPKSLPKKVTAHTKKPDLDKLLRAVKDALTSAGVWRDDAQVVYVCGWKAYAENVAPHVRIVVSEG